MSAPPGRRSAPGKTESTPESLGSHSSIKHTADTEPLRHGLTAVYIRDTDPQSIARRRLGRGRRLNAEQQQAYEAWLAEQRQDAAS